MAMILFYLSTTSINTATILCGTTKLRVGLLIEALLKINFRRHALDMVCERYICRRTPLLQPDSPDSSVPLSLKVWKECTTTVLGVNSAILANLSLEDAQGVVLLLGAATAQRGQCYQDALTKPS